MRNIVSFKDKNKATINSKVVLQYYINRKNVEIKRRYKTMRQIIVTPVQKNPFLQLRKSLCIILRNNSVKEVKK